MFYNTHIVIMDSEQTLMSEMTGNVVIIQNFATRPTGLQFIQYRPQIHVHVHCVLKLISGFK